MITQTQQQIINVIGSGINDINLIADKLQIKSSAVFGTYAQLKKQNLAVYKDGKLFLTDEGQLLIEQSEIKVEQVGNVTVKSRPGTKKLQAWSIIEQMTGRRHKEVIAELVNVLGITQNNAGLYIHNYKVQHKS